MAGQYCARKTLLLLFILFHFILFFNLLSRDFLLGFTLITKAEKDLFSLHSLFFKKKN